MTTRTLSDTASATDCQDPAALRDKLRLALADLGDTPDLVAAVLQAHGCVVPRRSRSRSEECPVAQFVGRQLGTEWTVSVSEVDVTVWAAGEEYAADYWDRLEARLTPLPPAVRAVVWGVDHHRYPALEG